MRPVRMVTVRKVAMWKVAVRVVAVRVVVVARPLKATNPSGVCRYLRSGCSGSSG